MERGVAEDRRGRGRPLRSFRCRFVCWEQRRDGCRTENREGFLDVRPGVHRWLGIFVPRSLGAPLEKSTRRSGSFCTNDRNDSQWSMVGYVAGAWSSISRKQEWDKSSAAALWDAPLRAAGPLPSRSRPLARRPGVVLRLPLARVHSRAAKVIEDRCRAASSFGRPASLQRASEPGTKGSAGTREGFIRMIQQSGLRQGRVPILHSAWKVVMGTFDGRAHCCRSEGDRESSVEPLASREQ